MNELKVVYATLSGLVDADGQKVDVITQSFVREDGRGFVDVMFDKADGREVVIKKSLGVLLASRGRSPPVWGCECDGDLSPTMSPAL